MNKIQTARLEAAKKLFQKLIRMSKLSSSVIEYDGMKINSDQIVFTDTSITVVIDDCYYTQFECNPAYDEGLFTRKADYAKYVRATFKLVKYVKW